MNVRRWLRIALLSCVAIGSIPLAGWSVMNSEVASVWLVRQIFSVFAQQMAVGEIHGRLREGLELKNFQFHNDSQVIDLKDFKLHWQLADLLTGRLKINALTLDGLTVLLLNSEKEESTFDPLAKIELPLEVAVERFLLTNAHIEQEEKQFEINKLQFSAATEQQQLLLHSLTVEGEGLNATAKGKTQLGEGFAFGLNVTWQFHHAEQGSFRGTLAAHGDSRAVTFQQQLQSPFVFQQQGRVEHLMTEPQFTLRGQWQNLRWPLTGNWVQIASQHGEFSLSGTAQNYQLHLEAQLAQAQLQQARLQFNGHGTAQGVHIEEFTLGAKLGQLRVTGDVGWHGAPQFAVQASGAHFNPAVLMPDMAGDLNFNTHLQGKVGEKLQLAVDIDHLTGHLRQYPVRAQGQLNLLNNQLLIKKMTFASGANQLSVQGGLGEKNAALDFALTAPQLHTLMPTLGGQLTARGHLQGELTQPSVQLNIDGKQLQLKNQSVKSLSATVDYAADDKKISQLHVSATGLRSGATQVSHFALNGQGTKTQHRFTAQVQSNQGDVLLALTGALHGTAWQARLSELNLMQAHVGRWQLQQPVSLTVNKHATGVAATLGETCFTQAAAVLCAQGDYPATGDFQGAAHARLPSDLAQKYLPPTVKFTGQLLASATVQKKSAGLNGRYQLDLSKNSQVVLTVDKQWLTVPLNTVSITGKLEGTKITNDFNLLVADKNYVRGQLQVDTGASQAISGQIIAGLMDFSPLQPFVLPLSELQGNLTAAVAVAGTLKKPAVTGVVSLNQAAVTVASAGLRLQAIDLKVQTALANAQQLQIAGQLKSGTGQLQLNGTVQLNPTLGFPTQLRIAGTQVDVVKLPIAHVSVSPELLFNYDKNGGALTGKLTVAQAQVQLEALPDNAAVPSEDEEIVGKAAVAKKAEPPAPPFAVDMTVDLGKHIHFAGLGLTADLLGALKINKKAEQLAVFGRVDLSKARYKSYGQDLTVRRGGFVFNGSPANPLLDVEAIRLSKSKKVTAVLKVTGDSSLPRTQIFAEPTELGISESDALSYLITGNPLNQLTKSDGNLLANAALSYGAGKVAWLVEKFGLDEFELQEGQTMKDSLLAIGQYLTPDFYVGAKVSLFSKQTLLVLKYKLSEAFSLSTQAGESQRVYINYELSHE